MKAHRTLLVIGLALVCMAMPVAAMAGGGKSYPTVYTKFKYQLKNGKSYFKGTIDSTKGNCIKDRKVVLYRKKNGDKKKLGGDHTNNDGKFSIDLGGNPPKNGTYFSEVNQTKIGSNNQNVCLSVKSGSVKLS